MATEAFAILSTGLIILIVSLPLVYRKVPMNQLYGIRIPAAFESDQRWYDINAYGGRQIAAGSVVIIICGAVGWYLPDTDAFLYAVLSAPVLLLAIFIPLIRVMRWSRLLPSVEAVPTASPATGSPDMAQTAAGHNTQNRRSKGIVLPLLMLVFLSVGFVTFVHHSSPLLPEQVATHFGADGKPNGWMSRPSYLHFVTVLGLTIALAIATLAFGLGKLRSHLAASSANDVRPVSCKNRNGSWMTGDILWLACLILCFVAGTHYLTIEANRSQPVHLPAVPLAILIAGFAAGNIGWISLFCFHRTRKIPGD